MMSRSGVGAGGSKHLFHSHFQLLGAHFLSAPHTRLSSSCHVFWYQIALPNVVHLMVGHNFFQYGLATDIESSQKLVNFN